MVDILLDKDTDYLTISQLAILAFLNHQPQYFTVSILAEHIGIFLNKIHSFMNQAIKLVYLTRLLVYIPFLIT